MVLNHHRLLYWHSHGSACGHPWSWQCRTLRLVSRSKYTLTESPLGYSVMERACCALPINLGSSHRYFWSHAWILHCIHHLRVAALLPYQSILSAALSLIFGRAVGYARYQSHPSALLLSLASRLAPLSVLLSRTFISRRRGDGYSMSKSSYISPQENIPIAQPMVTIVEECWRLDSCLQPRS